MFGWSELGRLETDALFCAAESGDGNVYVGAWGARYRSGVSGSSYEDRPGLYLLDGGVFAAVTGFDGTWVEALRGDDTGVWAVGGARSGSTVVLMAWRLESGVVVEERLYDGPQPQLSDVLQGTDGELHMAGLKHCLAELRGTVYDLGPAGWVGPPVEYDRLGGENSLAAFQGRIWSTVVRDLGTQALAWWDGQRWQPVATWEMEDGEYYRLAAIGNRLYLFGTQGMRESLVGVCGWFDGQRLLLGEQLPWVVQRANVRGRRALLAVFASADIDWSWITNENVGRETYHDTPLAHEVVQIAADLMVHGVIQEFGTGTGDGPEIASVEQEFGDGTGAGPEIASIEQEFGQGGRAPEPGVLIVHGVIQEFGTGMGAGPRVREVEQGFGDGTGEGPTVEALEQEFGTGGLVEVGERVRWATEDVEGACVALLAATGETPAVEAGIRGLVRCDAEGAPVEQWDSYQGFDLNVRTVLERPGEDVRIGIVAPAGVEPDVGVPLVRD